MMLFTGVAIGSLIFTCFLLTVGIILVRQEQQFGRDACLAQAVIVDLRTSVRLKRKRGGGRQRYVTYHPVVQFQRADGPLAGQPIPIICEVPIGSSPPMYSVGTQIPILYDPANPTHVHINTFRGRWLGLCIWFLISLLLLLMGMTMACFTLSRTFHP